MSQSVNFEQYTQSLALHPTMNQAYHILRTHHSHTIPHNTMQPADCDLSSRGELTIRILTDLHLPEWQHNS